MTVELRSRQAAAGIHAAVAQVEPRVLPSRRRFFGRRAFIAIILAILTPPAGVALVNAIRDDDPRTNQRIVDDAQRREDDDRVPPRERTTEEDAVSRAGGVPTTDVGPRQGGRTTRTTPTMASLGLTGRLAFSAMDEPVRTCGTSDCSNSGTSDIRTMDLRSGRVTPLASSQLFETAARWSPDGSRLAYPLLRGDPTTDGLYTTRADGTDKRRIASEGGNATWSPDGRRIAFVVEPAHENVCVGGTQDRPECGIQEVAEQQEIRMVDADGTDLHRVEEIPTDQNPREPAWSPNGRYLAFVQGGYADPSVYVLDFQSKQIEWISSGSRPAWAPDGKRLAIANNDLVEVIAMPSGQVIETVSREGHSLGEPAWSPDGEWIAFTARPSPNSEDARRSIWVARANGSSMKVVIEGGPQEFGAPSWTVALPPE
jgi:Tol biopolymer transport system component